MEQALKTNRQSATYAFILSSLLVVLFLFYIDEGNYSFENLFHPGNLLALSVYFIAMILAQFTIYFPLVKRLNSRSALLIAILAGIPLGVFVAVMFFYAIAP